MLDGGGGASLGTAQGQITIDVSQAQNSLQSLGGSLDSFNGRATSVGQSVNNFSQSTVGLAQGMQNVGRVVTGLGATMEAPFILAAKSAMDLESTMAGVNSVMDLTGTQFQDLTALAQQLGKDTVFTGTQAAQGIEELGKAGVSFDDIMAGAAQSATDLAAAGGIEVPQAAAVMSAAMQAFNISGENSVRVADALAGAANASLSDVNQLGIGLGQVAGVANAAGMSLEETTAFLALMADNGIRGSDAATSMKNAILSLLSPTDKAAGLMDAMGVSVLDASGNFVGLAGASQAFFDAWKTSGQTMEQFLNPLNDIVGRDAVRTILFGMQAIEDQQKGLTTGWGHYLDEVSKTGTAHEVARKRMDSLAGSIDILKGSLDVLGENIGLPIITGIRPVVDALTEFVNKLIDLPPAVLGAVGVIGSLAGIVTTLGGAFLVVGGYVLEAVARFEATGITLGEIAAVAGRVTLGLTIIGVTAAAVALAIQTNFLGIRDAIQFVIDKIQEVIDKFKLFFSIGKAEAGDQGPQGKGLFSDMAKNISAFGRAIDAVLGTNVSGFFDTIAQGADNFNTLRVNLSHAADMMKIFTDASQRVTPIGKKIEAMGKTIDRIFGTDLSGAFRTAAIGIDAFGQAMQIFAADGTLQGLPALLESASIGLEAAFGTNVVSDTLSNMSSAVKSMQDAFASAQQNGLNPFEAGLRALAVGAQIAGFNGLADALDAVATTAIKFGDNFSAAQDAVAAKGIVGLPNTILALNDAMLATIGIGLPDFMIGAANAMAAFQTAMSNGLDQGLNPFQAALKGLGAAIGSVFGTDARNQFFAFVDAMGKLGTAVQGAITSGLDRVGQMFSEIGTALSTGDISGALDAVGSLVSDVGAALQEAGQKALDWAINVGEPALAGWAAEQAGKFGEWLKGKITGFGDLAGQTLTNIQGWFLEVGAPQLTGWVQGGAALIGPELQKAVQFAGDTLANLAGWLLEVGAPQLTGWVQGGAALIGPEIQKALNFAGETLGKIAGWIAEVGAPQLDGWVRDAKGAIGTAIQGYMPTAGEKLGDVKSWILEVGIPTVQAVAGFVGGIADQITGLISDPAIVAQAENAGKAAGTTIGQKLGSALATSLVSALDGALSGTGSQAHGADAGAGGGSSITASASKAAGNIFDGFGDAFAKAAIEAFGKEMAKAKEQIITGVQAAFVQAVSDILNTPLVPNATNNPVTTGAAGGNAVNDFVVEKLGLGPNSNIGQFILDQANASKAANQAAAQEGTKIGVVDPAIAGAQLATGSPLDAIGALKDSALGTILDLKNFIDPTQQGAAASANAATATDAVTQSIVDPFGEAIDGFPSLLRDMVANQGPASQEAINSGVQDMSLGTALDQTMATQIGDVSLDTFSAAMGQKIGEAVLAGMTNATTANVGGSGGGTAAGGIGESIVGALTTSLQTADFSAVGTAISTQIGVALSAGFSQAQAAGPSTAGVDIGSQIALSLASAITGSDFTVVSQAIQQKIGQSLSGGTGGTVTADTSAVAGEGATIGASIAAALANAILASDFTVVGQAIQQKISQAVSAASSGATTGGAGAGLGGVVGQGGGIASGIVSSIVSAFTNADYSGIGTAVSTGVSSAITEGMANVNLAVVDGIGTAIQNGMVAAESASEIGNVFTEAAAGTIASTSGSIDIAATTSITTAVTDATSVAAAAGPVGTAFTTAVGAGIGGGTGTVISAANATMTSATSSASGIAAGASVVGTAFDTAIGGGIGAGAGTVTAAATAVMASASAAAQGVAASSGGAIGAAFDQGIASGIGANAGVVTAAAAAVVNSAVAAAQGAGKISSPSKVMMTEVGEPLVEGVIVGMDNKGPDVDKAAQRLINRIVNHVKNMKPLMDQMTQMADQWAGLPILDQIGSQLSTIAGHIDSTISSVKSSMKDVFKSISDTMKQGRDKLKGDSSAVADSATSSFNSILKDRKSSIRDAMKTTKGGILDISALQNDVDALREQSKVLAMADGGQVFADRVNAMADSLQKDKDTALSAAIDLFQRLDNQLDIAKKKHRQKGAEAGSDIGAGVTDGITASTPSTTKAVDSLTDTVINTFNANLSRLPEMATAIGEATGQGLATGLDNSQPTVEKSTTILADDLAGGINKSVPQLEGAATNAADKFTSALNTAIQGATGTVGTSGEAIGSALSDGTTNMIADSPIRSAVTDFVTGLTGEIQSRIGIVNSAGQSIGTAFTKGVSSAAPTIAGKGLTDQVETGITAGVPSAAKEAETAGSTIGSGMETGIASACKPVNDQATSLTGDCVPAGLDSGLPTATRSAAAAGGEISDSLKGAMELKKRDVSNAFKGAGEGFGSSLAGAISGKTTENKNAVTGLTSTIGNISANAEGNKVGTSFGAGLVQGIGSKKADIETAARAVIKAAEQAANDEAGSNSPSRLFAEVGMNMMLGLQDGLKEGTAGVVAQSTKTTREIAGIFAGQGMGTAVNTLQNNLGLYTQSIKDALNDTEDVVKKSPFGNIILPTDKTTMARQTGNEQKLTPVNTQAPITIGNITVAKGSKAEKMLLDLADHLQETSGQYVRTK